MNPSPQESTRLPGCAGSLSVAGVPVRFHFTFWLFALWLIFLGASGDQSAAGNTLYILGLFFSVLAHELGHLAAARHFGIATRELVMLPLGGLARLARLPRPAEELWVALAGPALNLAAGLGLLAYTLPHGESLSLSHWIRASDSTLLSRLAMANLILAGFNLLPAFPMDGGRIVRSLLASSGRRTIERATRLTARLGSATAFGLGLYGLISSNFVFVFVAFFVYVGAMQEVLATSTQALLDGATVADAMATSFVSLTHADTIAEASSILAATPQRDFPVFIGPNPAGLLTREDLLRALAAEGPDSYVAGAMRRDFTRLSPALALTDAAPLLAQDRRTALVFEGERLVGLLNSENLSDFLVLRRSRARLAAPEPE